MTVVIRGTKIEAGSYYLGLAAHIKEIHPDCLTLMGGPHPTYFPDVIKTRGLDVICRGEGEDATVELAECEGAAGDELSAPEAGHEDELGVEAERRTLPAPARTARDARCRAWCSTR